MYLNKGEDIVSDQERDLQLYKSLMTASKILNDKARTNIKSHGLTFENLLVIERLYKHGPHYIQTLSDKLMIPSGSITYIVNKLEKKGIVRREIQTDNKRFCKAILTDEGQTLFTEIHPTYTNDISDTLSQFDDKAKTDLKNLLDSLCDGYQLDN